VLGLHSPPRLGARRPASALRREALARRPASALRLEALAIFLALAPAYALTPAGNHAEAEDSLGYLALMRDGPLADLSHPHHLAYHWLGWGAYQLARALGHDGGPLAPVRALGAAIGGAALAARWLLLRAVAPGRLVATTACGLVAFSYGFWWYSGEVEVYGLSALLLILALRAAWHAATRPGPRAFALLGAAGGLALLGHSTNALFASVALVALLRARGALGAVGVARSAATCGGAAALVAGLPYALAIATAGRHDPGGVHGWLTDYARSGQWGNTGPAEAPRAAIGAGRAVLGGLFAFAPGPLHDAIAGALPGSTPRWQRYLMRDFDGRLALGLLALSALVAAGVARLLVGWRAARGVPRGARTLALLCLGWLVPYAAFFTWWEPTNVEFWIAPWVALAVLAALPLAARPRAARARWRAAGVAALLAALLAANLVGSILPQHSPGDDYWRARAAWYERHAAPTDLIVATNHTFANYLRYFGRAEVLNIDHVAPSYARDPAGALSEIRRRIDASSARRVLFTHEVFFPGADGYAGCPHLGPLCGFAPALREAFLDQARLVDDAPLERVWAIERGPDVPRAGPAAWRPGPAGRAGEAGRAAGRESNGGAGGRPAPG
jgi:hypothetical protein